MKITRVFGALLVLGSVLPATAFALPDCQSLCSPESDCGRICWAEIGGVIDCGTYGCCADDQNHCFSSAASSSSVTLDSKARCSLANPLAAQQPTTALSLFLSQ